MSKFNYDESIQKLAELFASVGRPLSQREAAKYKIPNTDESLFRKRGISWNQVKADAWARASEILQKADNTKTIDVEKAKVIIKHQNEIIHNLVHERDKIRYLFECIKDSIESLEFPQIEPRYVSPNPDFSYEEMHLPISDVHLGSKILLEDATGLNEYNHEIFLKELKTYKEKISLFLDIYSATANINKIVIIFLGDLVEGQNIFKNQHYYVDKLVVDQIMDGVLNFSNLILFCASLVNEVEVYAVPGNHGRVSKDSHLRVNWDYITYIMMQMIVTRYPSIKMFVSNSPSMIVRHGEHNFFYQHGSNVKSWGGIPFYGITRQMEKLTNLFGLPISYNITAHYHQATSIPLSRSRIIMNGSWVGGSPLSIDKMHTTDVPTQWCWRFHHKEGINNMNELRLREFKPLRPNKDGIFTPIAAPLEISSNFSANEG